MSLSERKCWYSNNCLHFFKVCCSIVLHLLAKLQEEFRIIVTCSLNCTTASFQAIGRVFSPFAPKAICSMGLAVGQAIGGVFTPFSTNSNCVWLWTHTLNNYFMHYNTESGSGCRSFFAFLPNTRGSWIKSSNPRNKQWNGLPSEIQQLCTVKIY